MPLANYGVLKGKAIGAKREDDESSPHYQVHILAGTGHNRIAVNSKSQSSPSELLFLVDDNFQHPLTARLPALAEGFTPLPRAASGGAWTISAPISSIAWTRERCRPRCPVRTMI